MDTLPRENMFNRKREFRRNKQLEDLLEEINTLLGMSEKKVLLDFKQPTFPVLLITGCARSGSTLIMQWLAQTGAFAYPTNFMARFYKAPYIGGRIQQMIVEPQYNFRDEFGDINQNISYKSSLGKTKGLMAPSEFWFFWRRFFKYGEIQFLDEQTLSEIDTDTFLAELAAIEAVFDKPLAMKGLIINWNIPFISSILDKVLFIHITRTPIYNAQSLLESRTRFFGNLDAWYSFKPPEYNQLKDLSPYVQVAGQVYYTKKAIEKGLAQLDTSRWMKVSYEQFCENPSNVFTQILKKLQQQGYAKTLEYKGPSSFDVMNQIRINQRELQKIADAYEMLSGVSN